ncbi:MAG: hypothetical protein WCK48_02020 [bacterium]
MNKNASSILKITSLSLLGGIIVLYSIYQAYNLITGPSIQVYTPQNGATYSQTLIEINGKAKNVAFLNLNGKSIFTDKDGKFSEKLLLSPGYNIIRLDGKDKFGTYTEKKLELILKEY